MTDTSGTEKTTIIRWILENYFREISVFVNCWKHRTTYEVLKEILLSLQAPVHGREPTGELIKELEKTVKKKKIIVCLDELDRLKDFDRLILISTFYHALMKLATRIKNSLALVEVEFPAYRADELNDIIDD